MNLIKSLDLTVNLQKRQGTEEYVKQHHGGCSGKSPDCERLQGQATQFISQMRENITEEGETYILKEHKRSNKQVTCMELVGSQSRANQF